MPIYEYRCQNGHNFDVFQSMSDDPISSCEVCDAPVQRVLHPVAVHFKGSGFYSTDYAGKGKSASSGDGDSSAGDSANGASKSKSDTKSDSKGDSKGESKQPSGDSGSAAKAGSGSDSS